MFESPAHAENLRGGVQFDTVADPFEAECFQGAFLTLGLANATPDLGNSDLFHIPLI
jgi:hypothetical protein